MSNDLRPPHYVPRIVIFGIKSVSPEGLSNFQLEGGFWYLHFKGFKSVFYARDDISLIYEVSKIILKMIACRADKVSWFFLYYFHRIIIFEIFVFDISRTMRLTLLENLSDPH